MASGLEHHIGGPGDGLCGELQRKFARQSHEDPGVGECLDHCVDIGGAAAAQSGHDIEQLLLHPHDEADGSEDFLRCRRVALGGGATERVGRGTLMDEGGRIGHDAHDTRPGTRGILEVGEGLAGDDRDEQPARSRAAGGSERGEGVGRFHAEDEHVGGGDECFIRRNAHARGGGERLGGAGVAVAHGDVFPRKSPGFYDALDERGGHFAGADEADFHARRVSRACVVWKRKSASRSPECRSRSGGVPPPTPNAKRKPNRRGRMARCALWRTGA